MRSQSDVGKIDTRTRAGPLHENRATMKRNKALNQYLGEPKERALDGKPQHRTYVPYHMAAEERIIAMSILEQRGHQQRRHPGQQVYLPGRSSSRAAATPVESEIETVRQPLSTETRRLPQKQYLWRENTRARLCKQYLRSTDTVEHKASTPACTINSLGSLRDKVSMHPAQPMMFEHTPPKHVWKQGQSPAASRMQREVPSKRLFLVFQEQEYPQRSPGAR